MRLVSPTTTTTTTPILHGATHIHMADDTGSGGGGISIGTVRGGIVMDDGYSKVITDLITRVTEVETKLGKLSSTSKNESDKVKVAFDRLAASLDPVVAGEQKLERAHTTLTAALSKGLISQQQHNDLLDKAKKKYEENANPLETLKTKVGELSATIGKFGGEAGEGLAKLTEGLLGIGESGAAAVVALGPLVAVAAALAVAAGTVSIGIVAFDWLKEVTVEGMKTQTVITALDQSLRSNGAAAGYTSHELVEMADKMSVASGKSKDLILTGLTTETLFAKIGHETFPEFAQAALDLGTRTGDIPGAFQKISIAAEGGGRSIASFKDIGINLTTQQKAMMKGLIDSGQTLEYQRLAVDLLKQHIGGLSDAYANTLQGSMERARNEFTLGKETIAGQIIPAITSAFNTLITWAGGWEKIHVVIQTVALDIGDAIHDMIYNALIAFDKFMIGWSKVNVSVDEIAISIEKAFFDLGIGILESLNAASVSTAMDPLIKGLQNLKAEAERQSKIQVNIDSGDVVKFTNDLTLNTKGLHDHSSALAGDTTEHAKHAKVLDDIPAKQKKVKDGIDAAIKAYNALVASVDAATLKLGEEIVDRERLIKALGLGDEAYKKEQASIAAEKQVRADLAALLKSYQTAVTDAKKAIEESTAAYGPNSDKVAQAKALLEQINVKYSESVVALKQLQIENVASAERYKQAEIDLSRLNKATAAYGTIILDTYKHVAEARKQLDSAKAGLQDEQTRIDLTSVYGSAVADLVVKLGYASDATRKFTIDSLVDAEVKEKNAHAIIALSDAEVDAIRKRITAEQGELATVKQQQAILQIKADIWKPLADGFQPVSSIILDGIRSWAEGGDVSAKSIAKSLLDWLLQAFEQILQKWITLQITMGTIEKARIIADANVAAGVNAVQSGQGVTGGLGFVSGGSSAASSSGASVGSLAGYAVAAYALFVAYKVLFDNTHTWSGEATIGADGATASLRSYGSYAQTAGLAINDLITSVKDVANQWHLGLASLTANSVSINLNSEGEIVVKTLIDGVGKVFKSMADAMDYAKVQALKYASYSASTDALIVAAIQKSKATTTAGLQSDIDFATRLATQNLPQITQQIKAFLQTFTDDFQHALDLFGPNGFRSLTDFGQLGPATSSILTQLTTSLTGLYNQLTGHKDDIKATEEAQRVAYNAERAITIAQIILLEEKIKAEIADYMAQLAFLRLRRDGTGGTDGGSTVVGPDPNKNPQYNGGVAEKNIVVVVTQDPGVDPRNPHADPQLAALLEVLDNLVRALAGLPPEIAPGGVVSGTGHGGGHASGVGDQRRADQQSVRDALASSDLKLAGDDFKTQLAAIGKQWDDEAKKAHGNKELLAQITAQREKEVEALRKELATKLATDISTFTGTGGSSWDQQRAALDKQAQDLRDEAIKTGTDLGWSAGQIETALGQINDAAKKHAKDLAQSAISSLSLPIEGTWEGIQKLADTVGYLWKGVQEGTVSAERFALIWAQVVDQSKLQVFGLAETIASSAGDATKAAEIKRKMDEINFNIQKAQFNILLTQYEALGYITGDDETYLEGLRTWVNTQVLPSGGGDTTTTTTTALSTATDSLSTTSTTFQSAVDQFKAATQSLLDGYNQLFGSTNTLGGSAQDRLSTARSQFSDIESRALAGDVTARAAYSQAAQNYLQVLNEANTGGAVFGSEQGRVRREWEALLAQTRFTLNGVVYDAGLGTGVTPTIIPSVGAGGSSVPSIPSVGGAGQGGGSGSLTGTTGDATGLLTQILTQLISINANQLPIINTISNNTGQESVRLGRLADTLDRLVVEIRQIAQAA
jgi:hypothetical protein